MMNPEPWWVLQSGGRQGRFDMKNLLRAASLAIVILTVGVAVPAFADGSTVTTTVVVAAKPSIYSGQAEVFRATVAPTKVGMTRITGSITWTVTGSALAFESLIAKLSSMLWPALST